jgi:hypothetical protein
MNITIYKEDNKGKLPDVAQSCTYYEPRGFCGGGPLYKVSHFGVVATEGAKTLFEEKKCFWIVDNIASYIPELKKVNDSMFFVKIVLNGDGGCDMYIDDGNYNIYIHQEIDYTDLDVNIQLYLSNEGQHFLVYLPSEY